MAAPACINAGAHRVASNTGQIVCFLPPIPERLLFFLFLSPLTTSVHYFSIVFTYREPGSFIGRQIPSDIVFWISLRRFSCGFVCGINPHYRLTVYTSQSNISPTEISSCLSEGKWQGIEVRNLVHFP